MEEQEMKYTIAEEYKLPSCGKIYDVPVDPNVTLRSMTGRDELKRQAPTSTPIKMLAGIIEGCMLKKPAVHVYDMAWGDYEYLLYRLRVVSYGDAYKVKTVCPECGEKIEKTIHIDDLNTIDFDEEKVEKLRSFKLPSSGKTITLRYQSPAMIDDISDTAKEMSKKFPDADINFNLLAKLEKSIETVDGSRLSDFEKENFINNLPVRDLNKIINHIDLYSAAFGVDSNVPVTCGKCGHEFDTFFLPGQEFFRPSEE